MYVDLFSENLKQLKETIPYLADLGLEYVHLMPLYAARPGNKGGGYAVSNYRSVDQKLGTIEDLSDVSTQLHERGMSLDMDYVQLISMGPQLFKPGSVYCNAWRAAFPCKYWS